MAWSRRTGGPWVGLSCALAAACSPPDEVISEILGSRDAKFVAVVSPTHLELRPADAWVWSAPVTDGSTELWLYKSDPGLPLGRHERAGDLLGGLEVPTPDTRLVPDGQDDAAETYRRFTEGAPPPTSFVRAPGCPLVRVQRVALPRRPFRLSLFSFGESVIARDRSGLRSELMVVRPTGEIEPIDRTPISADWISSAGTTLDRRRFVFSDGVSVFVSSTTATPPLSDARPVQTGVRAPTIKPDASMAGWVVLGATGVYAFGAERRAPVEYANGQSPFDPSGPIVVDESGGVVGTSIRDASVLVRDSGVELAQCASNVIDLGFVASVGLVAVIYGSGPLRAHVNIIYSDRPRDFVFEPSQPFRSTPEPWTRVQRGGLTMGDGRGLVAYVESSGRVCPIVAYSPYPISEDTPPVLGRCVGEDCRWRPIAVGTFDGDVYFITPLE